MITWWRQLIGKTRYFIVAYTYQIKDSNSSSHGQLSSQVTGGGYISVDSCVESVEEYTGEKICTFLIDNIIEMNKKDYKYYQEHNIKLDEESDNDNDIGES